LFCISFVPPQALAEFQAQESSLAAKKAELEAKSESGPVVQRGRAKAELEQLKAEDPLPLRRAKINQEAAVRRFQKAQARASEEASKAASAASIATSSANIATETRKQVPQSCIISFLSKPFSLFYVGSLVFIVSV
jgi:hypothetical protein